MFSYVTSNTDSGSRSTNSYGGQNSVLVNTTSESPSNAGEESSASSEKSSTSSNVESVGSENPASANSVSKAYEILNNIVKNPQSLVLPALLGFIVLALLFVGYKQNLEKKMNINHSSFQYSFFIKFIHFHIYCII